MNFYNPDMLHPAQERIIAEQLADIHNLCEELFALGHRHGEEVVAAIRNTNEILDEQLDEQRKIIELLEEIRDQNRGGVRAGVAKDEESEKDSEDEKGGDDEQEIEESEDEDEDEMVELPTRPITVEDVVLHIPPNIKQNLIDDCEVLKIGYLPKLPVSVTIDEIVKQYEHHICPEGAIEEQLKDRKIECKEITDDTKFPKGVYILAVQAITNYFNNVCRFLLFPPECEQYDRLVADECGKAKATTAELCFRPSAFYGFQHLIRTINTLPEHIAQQEWNDHMLKTLLHAFNHFFAWLDANFERFFSRDDYFVYNPALEETTCPVSLSQSTNPNQTH